jgi:hypothetical protein
MRNPAIAQIFCVFLIIAIILISSFVFHLPLIAGALVAGLLVFASSLLVMVAAILVALLRRARRSAS